MILSAGVLLLMFESLGGVFFFSKKKSKHEENEMDHEYDHLLCRFVTDGSGRKIGESVTIHDDIMIIKAGGRFLGVPLKHIEEKGKTVLVKGLVDFGKAHEMGEEWRKDSFRDINQKNQKDESEGKTDGF